jgi:two-component system, LytTR family, sensor kinase
MTRFQRRYLFWGLLPAAWLLLALITSMQPANLYQDGKLEPMPWTVVFGNQLRHFFWWMVVAPVVIVLARKFAFRPGMVERALAFHAVAGVVISLVFIALRTTSTFSNFPFSWPPSLDTIKSMLPPALGVYWLIVAIVTAVESFRRYMEKQRETAELEAQLSKAQLAVLRMQLEPHFLFNTLNTISALIESRPADARRMITQVGDLLRENLETEPRSVVPLEEELDWIERYLEIQQVRFRDRLSVTMHVEPSTLRAAVPALILQPLVENAIKHGLEPETNRVTIDISAEARDGALVLTVTDDGAGLPAGEVRERVGLGNTRRRLQTLYGDDQRTVLRAANRGVEAIVEFPLTQYENGKH